MKTQTFEFTGLADLDQQITAFKDGHPEVMLDQNSVKIAQTKAMYLDKEMWEKESQGRQGGSTAMQIPYSERD
jgi:hypothetical protein